MVFLGSMFAGVSVCHPNDGVIRFPWVEIDDSGRVGIPWKLVDKDMCQLCGNNKTIDIYRICYEHAHEEASKAGTMVRVPLGAYLESLRKQRRGK